MSNTFGGIHEFPLATAVRPGLDWRSVQGSAGNAKKSCTGSGAHRDTMRLRRSPTQILLTSPTFIPALFQLHVYWSHCLLVPSLCHCQLVDNNWFLNTAQKACYQDLGLSSVKMFRSI